MSSDSAFVADLVQGVCAFPGYGQSGVPPSWQALLAFQARQDLHGVLEKGAELTRQQRTALLDRREVWGGDVIAQLLALADVPSATRAAAFEERCELARRRREAWEDDER